jgi:transcriptional regulator with XRE-family HTH domain
MPDDVERLPAVERFKAWRAWRGWSQSEAAAALGCSQALVSQIERGDAVVSKLALAVRIEHASKDWPEGPIRVAEWVAADEHPTTIATPADLPECA